MAEPDRTPDAAAPARFLAELRAVRRAAVRCWSRCTPSSSPCVVAAVVILLVGGNPLEAYWALLDGMFGTPDRIAASLGRSTPFIGAALAVAFAFRAGLFNIGAEGQLLVGATTAAWVGTFSLAGRRARPDRHPDRSSSPAPSVARSRAASRAC